VLADKASIRDFHPDEKQLEGVLDGYRLPRCGLELLVMQRHGTENELPWLLIKVGKPSLAGVDVDVFELLDADSETTQLIINQGLRQWAG